MMKQYRCKGCNHMFFLEEQKTSTICEQCGLDTIEEVVPFQVGLPTTENSSCKDGICTFEPKE